MAAGTGASFSLSDSDSESVTVTRLSVGGSAAPPAVQPAVMPVWQRHLRYLWHSCFVNDVNTCTVIYERSEGQGGGRETDLIAHLILELLLG